MRHHSNKTLSQAAWQTALLVVFCFMAGCNPAEKEKSVAALPELTRVEVKEVTKATRNRIIAVSGALEADKTAPLSFQVSGKVARLNVDEGDVVQSGAVLAILDDTDYRNNLASAEAALLRAKDVVKRYGPLYRETVIAERSLVEVETALSQAEAARDTARKALADTRLTTPIPGVVGAKGIEVGQMVSPEVPAFTIVKTDVVYARVSVPESEIGQVRLGQGAKVAIPALGGQAFDGTVSMVGAVADESTRTYPVKIKLPNPNAILRPGMIAEAAIRGDNPVTVLTIPGSAIVRDADNLTYAFVASEGKDVALRRRVAPGSTLHDEIEIESGLVPGDLVVVSGQHKLADGAPITIATERD